MRAALTFILLMILFSIETIAQSNSCADSVRITYFYHDYDRYTQYTEASITIDTFDLDSGIVHGCTIAGPDVDNLSIVTCSDNYWSKTISTIDSIGRIRELLTLTGSATGWQNASRIVYTFDPLTNKISNQSNETSLGAAWQIDKLQTWGYDTSANLIEKTEENFNAGTIQNGVRTTWNYSSDTLISKNTFYLDGTLWLNINQYLFSYDSGGYRDSVILLNWDTTNFAWDTIGNSLYYLENGKKLAQFTTRDTVYINSTLQFDSISFSIDTLENIIHYYKLYPTYFDPMGLFYRMIQYNNDYYAGELENIWQYSATWFDEGSGELSWYCTDNNFTTTYDSLGYITSTVQRARCVMPQSFTTTYIYNSDHILIRITGYLDNNTQSDYYSYDYYFGKSDSLIVFLSPFVYQNQYLCQNTYVNPGVVVLGGCGTYHYQWSPNINLSSDTILNPDILVGDSITYTLNVSDSLGNFESLQYNVFPAVASHIQFDTTNCLGCSPHIETTYQPNYTYQWYLDGVMIANSDTSSIELLATGNYFVEVSVFNRTCVSISDTLFYVSTLSESNLIKTEFSVYPNPVDETLYIQFPDEQKWTFTIYNSFGQKLKCHVVELSNRKYKIEMKEEVSGIYYLVLNNAQEKRMKLIVKN